MHILVGALVGALLCGLIAALIVASNWTYARKNRQVGTVATQSLVGGAVLGAIIGLFL